MHDIKSFADIRYARGGRYGKNIAFFKFYDFNHYSISCRFNYFVKLSEQYCQIKFPVIKTESFKVKKIKNKKNSSMVDI